MNIVQRITQKIGGGGPLLVVGLGNPEEEYAGTRHNAGADAVRLFAKRAGLSFEMKRDLFSEIAKGRGVTLADPTTFMNQSGKAVAALAHFFRTPPDRIVIIHDDMDLPFGTIKIVFDRGSGGHKGVESVFRALKTKAITRIRIGTMGSGRSQKPGHRKLENIVVKHMTPSEKKLIAKGVRRAADALDVLLAHGRERAMSEFNE